MNKIINDLILKSIPFITIYTYIGFISSGETLRWKEERKRYSTDGVGRVVVNLYKFKILWGVGWRGVVSNSRGEVLVCKKKEPKSIVTIE